MILALDRGPLFSRIERRSLRNRPALEYAFELETEVVVKSARSVLLDDERPTLPVEPLPRRLRRLFEITLFAIFFEAHGSPFSRSGRGAFFCPLFRDRTLGFGRRY